MNNKLIKYWNEIHKQYDSTYDNWLNSYIHLFKKSDSFVELGCGRAYSSRFLYQNGYKNITACDFSEEAINIINKQEPNLKTMVFDLVDGLPFKDNSVNIIIADLCLHYFNNKTTKYIFDEIHRILSNDGYLIARINSTNDILNIPKNKKEIEKNFYFDGLIYKRFFEESDFTDLFKNFNIIYLKEKRINKYENDKISWEFCLQNKNK